MIYNGVQYDSKAAIVRAMFMAGDIDNSPDQKKRVATLLGMTVQTVHATLVKMNAPVVQKTPVIVPKNEPVANPSDDIVQMIRDRFDQCYNELALDHNIRLAPIPIRFDLRGGSAGQFCFGMSNYFRVNLEIAKNNLVDYMKQTIPHEVCHYVNFVLTGRSCGHGLEWKRAMIRLFGLEPKRCHNYNVSNLKTHRKPFVYKCDCREHNLSAIKHSRMIYNPHQYRCVRCSSFLTFVKKV